MCENIADGRPANRSSAHGSPHRVHVRHTHAGDTGRVGFCNDLPIRIFVHRLDADVRVGRVVVRRRVGQKIVARLAGNCERGWINMATSKHGCIYSLLSSCCCSRSVSPTLCGRLLTMRTIRRVVHVSVCHLTRAFRRRPNTDFQLRPCCLLHDHVRTACLVRGRVDPCVSIFARGGEENRGHIVRGS